MTALLTVSALIGWIDVAHAQDAETPVPSPQVSEETAPPSTGIAEAEAALQRTQQAAAQAQARIAEAEAQLEHLTALQTDAGQHLSAAQQQLSSVETAIEAAKQRLIEPTTRLDEMTQQIAADEQQLAALQHQAADAHSAALGAANRLSASELQLAQLNEQRSAIEQQVNLLQQQELPVAQAAAEAMQKRLTDTTAQLEAMTQQAAAAEQQVSTLAAQVERGKQDTSGVEARLAEARKQEEQIGVAARAETMVRRGDALLDQGDVSAARLLYDRAATAGSGRAATAMGKTFDPAFLTRIGAIGLSADPKAAGIWYHRGIELGDEEASIRLHALPSATNRTNPALAKRP